VLIRVALTRDSEPKRKKNLTSVDLECRGARCLANPSTFASGIETGQIGEAKKDSTASPVETIRAGSDYFRVNERKRLGQL
jgi:hypothetical protein